ncbi:hypothetical protein [Oceanobacter antarcticus]|uniref:Uncharacterized protein n=1 Tax=Oceanobacter antarcticus TaxID=3133425 RepID=A0ABW8NM70_9GAMM
MTTHDRHSISGQARPEDKEMDWSQIGETLAMLALAVAQIETSLTEGGQSVDKLSTNFTGMANNTLRILQITRDEPLQAEEPTASRLRSEIHQIATEVNQEIQEAIIAFQFYDRLTQRLDHVSRSLEHMGHLMADGGSRYQPNAWQGLQQEIKGYYTMEAERIMFEQIMAGKSVAEALKIYHHHFRQSANDTFDTTDEIELF